MDDNIDYALNFLDSIEPDAIVRRDDKADEELYENTADTVNEPQFVDNKGKHDDCLLNYAGPSTGMECVMVVAALLQIYAEFGAQVNALIMDGDSRSY